MATCYGMNDIVRVRAKRSIDSLQFDKQLWRVTSHIIPGWNSPMKKHLLFLVNDAIIFEDEADLCEGPFPS